MLLCKLHSKDLKREALQRTQGKKKKAKKSTCAKYFGILSNSLSFKFFYIFLSAGIFTHNSAIESLHSARSSHSSTQEFV